MGVVRSSLVSGLKQPKITILKSRMFVSETSEDLTSPEVLEQLDTLETSPFFNEFDEVPHDIASMVNIGFEQSIPTFQNQDITSFYEQPQQLQYAPVEQSIAPEPEQTTIQLAYNLPMQMPKHSVPRTARADQRRPVAHQ